MYPYLKAAILIIAASFSSSSHASSIQCNKECALLASIIEAEAGGASELDKIAVAHTVLNRTKGNKWPSSIKKVVKQKKQYASPKRAEQSSKEIAQKVISGKIADPTRGATFFHTRKIRTNWSKGLTKTLKTKSHVFMKEKK